MPEFGFTEVLISVLSLLVGYAYVGRPLAKRFLRSRVSVVDEYSLSLGASKEFPTVLLTLKLDNGRAEGPFEFVPAFAHQLSDELCVSAARSVKQVTNLRSAVPVIDMVGGDESA
jgi:hypothetical protein